MNRLTSRRWFWYGVLVGLAILDGIQTVLLLSDLGVRSEANPLMNVLISRFGFSGMWALKLLTLVAVGVYVRRFSQYVLPTLNVAMLLVVINNGVHMVHYADGALPAIANRADQMSVEPGQTINTGRLIETDEFIVYLAPEFPSQDASGEGL